MYDPQQKRGRREEEGNIWRVRKQGKDNGREGKEEKIFIYATN